MKHRSVLPVEADITPGLLFYDFDDPLHPDSIEGPWLVIQKVWHTKLSGGYWEYLCLGPGPIIEKRRINWIIKVFDPKVM